MIKLHLSIWKRMEHKLYWVSATGTEKHVLKAAFKT